MSQIADTENALMRLLGECQLPEGVSIESAPGEWSPGYVQRLLSSTPAVRLGFLGARPWSPEERSTSLVMRAEWAAYCIVGWQGQDQAMRRLAVDGGYDMTARVAPILHGAIIEDAERQRLPIPDVTGIEVLTDAALDAANLWIAAVVVEVELPLDIPEDCQGPLDDFLRVRGDMVHAPDPAAPVPLAVDLPQ